MGVAILRVRGLARAAVSVLALTGAFVGQEYLSAQAQEVTIASVAAAASAGASTGSTASSAQSGVLPASVTGVCIHHINLLLIVITWEDECKQ